MPWRRTRPYFVAATAGGAINFLLIPWWLHLYGVAAYGQYAVTWTIAISCASGCVGWIRQTAMRAAGTRIGIGELPLWVVVLAVLLTGVLAASASASLGVLRGLDVLAGAALGSSLACAQLAATVIQRDDQGWRYALSELVRALTTVVVTVLLGVRGSLAGERVLLLAVSAGSMAVTLFIPRLSRFRTRPGALREWWSYGWPLSAWLTLAPLVLFTDRIVLQRFAEPNVVGSFAALSDLVVRGSTLAATPFVTAGSVWAMREFNRGRESLVLREMRRLALLSIAASALSAVAIFAVRDGITGFLGLGAVPPACFPLLAVSGGLWQAAAFAHKPLELRRQTRTMLLQLVLALVVVAFTSLVLVPAKGAVGAAIAVSLGVSSYLLLTMIASRPRSHSLRAARRKSASRV